MKMIKILLMISTFIMISAVTHYAQDKQPPPSEWPYPIADKYNYSFTLFDLLEYQRIRNVDAVRWDVVSWYGGDYQRLWLKSEGSLYSSSIGEGQFDFQALYGKLISPFFDFQAGLRFEQHRESDSNPIRFFAVVGLQGLMPYVFEIEPILFLSNKGKLSGRFTAAYDMLFTQQLILQSRFETELAVQKDEEFGVDPGFNDVELGFRLRYEFTREFAPYLGVSYRQSIGAARDRILREGGATNELQLVAGLRTWF